MSYAGAEWVESSYKVKCSPLGRSVADLLGWLFRGIYHIHSAARKVQWEDDYCIKVKLGSGGSLATWDNNLLTMLVLACHRMAIRVEISPCNPQLLTLLFHQRGRAGGLARRHPTIYQAIEDFERSCDLPVVVEPESSLVPSP